MANRIFLIGNLTRDPELSQTPNGISVCKFSIAVARKFTNQDGERETDFFNVVAWRGLGENAAKFLSKGKKACVIGSLQMRTYEDKDGVKRMAVEVIADDVEFLTPKSEQESDYKPSQANTKAKPKQRSMDDFEAVEDSSDLPF